MADTKISALTDGGALQPGDKFPIARSGADYALLGSAVGSGATGWVPDGNTWVYVSATSFKVTGVDVTAQFPKGTKIRLKQGGGFNYFVVAAASFSTDTTVTIVAGSDYSLANASISENSYSYVVTPQGHPLWFSYTPTWSSNGTQPTLGNATIFGQFCLEGLNLFYRMGLTAGSTTTFGSGLYALSLPSPFQYFGNLWATAYLNDASVAEYNGSGTGGLTGGDVALRFQTNSAGITYWSATSPFTFGNGDTVLIVGHCRIV